jgi:antitoxin PrlF
LLLGIGRAEPIEAAAPGKRFIEELACALRDESYVLPVERAVLQRFKMATTVTTKGQVTIPQRVRERLGIVPGSKVEFELGDNDQVVLTKVDAAKPASRFEKWRGRLGKGLSTDEIMAFLRD